MGGYGVASAMEDEYTKLIKRMNPTRVVIDNDACNNATVIRIYSANRQGILLEVVQVLTDLDLVVTKAYVSSDGVWLMDVFHVVDREENKIWDNETIHYIQKTIETDACMLPSLPKAPMGLVPACTSIELTGPDRPGLLSEVCAVLASLMCNVVKAEVWTHNSRVAAIVQVTEGSTGCAIEDPQRLCTIKEFLCNVLRGGGGFGDGKARVGIGATHIERRMHQLMFDDRDYEGGNNGGEDNNNNNNNCSSRPNCVKLIDCFERDYTIAILRCKDRPKLLFDTVCTLTDMQYSVFHGTVDATNDEAYQEYYIRHVDGVPINSEGERRRVIQCLEAAIERRATEGLQLEMRTKDRIGLLSEITRMFRENGLRIQRANICMEGEQVMGTFHLCDMSGGSVDVKVVDSLLRQQIGQTHLRVKHDPRQPPAKSSTDAPGFLLGSFLKVCSFQNFGLIGSCS